MPDTGDRRRSHQDAPARGERTLERLFLAETGMTIGQWRRRLRLVRALEMLAAGRSVTTVAAAVGYATPSAFTAMFRTRLSEPPGRYLDAGRRVLVGGHRPA